MSKDRILLGGAPEGYDARLLARELAKGQPLIHIARDDKRAEAMRAVMTMQLFDPTLLSDEIINERAPIAATQTQAARSILKVPNMTTRLHELQCPVFGFWGVNDLFNPVSGTTKLMDNCPQARMVLVNRCGHWVQVEHRDLFNRSCIDFLTKG